MGFVLTVFDEPLENDDFGLLGAGLLLPPVNAGLLLDGVTGRLLLLNEEERLELEGLRGGEEKELRPEKEEKDERLLLKDERPLLLLKLPLPAKTGSQTSKRADKATANILFTMFTSLSRDKGSDLILID